MSAKAVRQYQCNQGIKLMFIDEPECAVILKALYPGSRVVGNGPIAVFRGPERIYRSDMVAQDCGHEWKVWGVFPGHHPKTRVLSDQPYMVVPKPPK